MGAIGMTYEQGGHGRAGLGVNTDEGYELTLFDRVAHHTTTGLSTVEIAFKNATSLNEEFRKFFQNESLSVKSYVLQGNADKIKALTQLLDKHEITYGFASNGTINGISYQTNSRQSMDAKGALVVSTQQPKGKMVKVLFEQNAKLSEPLTYDITAWSIPYAFGLDCIASTSVVATNGNNPFVKQVNQVAPASAIAGYIVPWKSMEDAKFLSALLQNDIRVRFSEKDLKINGEDFPKGSLIITKSDNKTRKDFTEIVTKTANTHNRRLYTTPTSFSDNGTDFGSTNVKLINKSRIAVLKGKGVSSLSYGAIWYFMEQQLKYPITSIDTDYFDVSQLENFDVLVLPSGWYQRALDSSAMDGLKDWIRKGGKVVAFDNALKTFEGKDGFDLKQNEEKEETKNEAENTLIPYDQRERAQVPNLITGSIYKIKLDTSHPLAFGYDDTYFSLKLGGDSYQFLEDGYTVGYIKGDAESVSGFSGDTAKQGLKNSLVFGEARMGQGSLVYLVDDVLFRSFWENGKLFFVNSLFLVNSNVFVLN